MKMYQKGFISFLLIAFINFMAGCYSFDSVTVPEYNQIEEQYKPDEMLVITKDGQAYHFAESNFYIENDTLYGKAIVRELSFEGKFAFGEIKSIQLEDFGSIYSTLMMISQYQEIEAESGKPDEIYLTKIDSTKYHFMKNDYYVENDTLYGKGKLLLILDRNIALSDIESIQYEHLNVLTSSLLCLGLTPIILFLSLVIAMAAHGKWGSGK